jgi:hypothetical protein
MTPLSSYLTLLRICDMVSKSSERIEGSLFSPTARAYEACTRMEGCRNAKIAEGLWTRLVGARGRNRTGTSVTTRGILSPLRLPIPPPGQRAMLHQGKWRLGSESNRRTRLCRPLHNHSATQPRRTSGVMINDNRRSGSAKNPNSCKEKASVYPTKAVKMERETRLELATPTLARSCSTN